MRVSPPKLRSVKPFLKLGSGSNLIMIGQFHPLTLVMGSIDLWSNAFGSGSQLLPNSNVFIRVQLKSGGLTIGFTKLIIDFHSVYELESFSLDSVDSGDSISLSEASVDQSTPVIVRKFFPETLLWILEEDLGLVIPFLLLKPVISPS